MQFAPSQMLCFLPVKSLLLHLLCSWQHQMPPFPWIQSLPTWIIRWHFIYSTKRSGAHKHAKPQTPVQRDALNGRDSCSFIRHGNAQAPSAPGKIAPERSNVNAPVEPKGNSSGRTAMEPECGPSSQSGSRCYESN
ncbi:hypothetical protein HDV57DRAFT_482894 [Trichoderma longibrachiatum]